MQEVEDRNLGRRAVRHPHRAHRMQQEERDLHRRIRERDESALLDCFDRFGALVLCALRHRTGDRQSAEQLTVRAFTLLWSEPERYQPQHGPMAFQLLLEAGGVLEAGLRFTPDGGSDRPR